MSRRHYDKAPNRPGARSGFNTVFRDALDIEDAAHAINQINARKRRDDREQSAAARTKVTLAGGAALAAWLKKDEPK